MTGDGTALLERLVPEPLASLGYGSSPARSWLADHGLPRSGEEWWKYADLDALTGGPWVPAARPPRSTLTADDIDGLAGSHGGPRLVFVDGTFVDELSDLGRSGGGASCTVRTATADEHVGLLLPERYDGFQALNDLAGGDGAYVRVDTGAHLDEPISVVHVSTGGAGLPFASHPRTTIDLGPGAQATIIETYVGLVAPHLANARTVIRVGERASLTHYKLLRGRPDAAHVAHTRISVATDANVRAWSLLVGAAVARNALDVELRGTGATAELEGLYLPVGAQRYDTAVTVHHAAPDGTSRQQYRGVIGDAARGAFSGRVIVDADTTGNDAGQVNRCLLLSRTAEADSRPWLEIFADDVRCTHGAAVGRLDDDALFYLRSRGIPNIEARQLLVNAFVDELVSSIDHASLRVFAVDLIASTTASDRTPG